MDLGPHATFIWAAYAAVAAGLAALLAWLVIDGRRQQAQVDALEARGAKRPSRASDIA
jgi:heme exporter protein D